MNLELTPEQQVIQRTARDLAEREFPAEAWEWARRDDYPRDNARALAKAGLLGMMIAGGSVEMLKNRIAEEIFQRRFSQRAPAARDR